MTAWLKKPSRAVLQAGISCMLLVMLTVPVAAASDEPGHNTDLSQKLSVQVSRWLEQAEQNDAAALFNLGQFYRKGVGMAPDLKQAEFFYRRAAELGHRAAQLNLGTLCYFADDEHGRADEAQYWWQKAAEQGEAQAAFQLGLLYLNGAGKTISADIEQAQVWLGRARDNGHPQAKEALAQVARLMQARDQSLGVRFTVQMGSFSDLEGAKAGGLRLQQRFASLKGVPVEVRSARLDDGRVIHRVHAGHYDRRDQAQQLCRSLQEEGQSCFVVQE
ncbi:SPOR domain-containing protein [Marinobacterium sediminicola]|uniref:Sel1 repeat-containing protein n=1 Tax=Marinobacterium sediminicola TaxID=518898 RepID=A0ABY1S152_9GAMM|nr:SPOR domain-containing protein [Marinobacterium sediminicola]ULG68377.1 SPOR domain-containing protein [Marinobacterium sediminicola]SMR74744.1 Sel1 repeat-containing protein [Marinobacterium sediminicola]